MFVFLVHSYIERLIYIRQMQNHMPVDIFGGCGQKCPNTFKDGRESRDCKLIIATEYKFYLAFENSICKDYVTEKFFRILKYNIIPVVLNGASTHLYVRLLFLETLYLHTRVFLFQFANFRFPNRVLLMP